MFLSEKYRMIVLRHQNLVGSIRQKPSQGVQETILAPFFQCYFQEQPFKVKMFNREKEKMQIFANLVQNNHIPTIFANSQSVTHEKASLSTSKNRFFKRLHNSPQVSCSLAKTHLRNLSNMNKGFMMPQTEFFAPSRSESVSEKPYY